MDRQKMQRVVCPVCGYRMPLLYTDGAESKGIHVTCKGRNCKHTFEVRIEKGKQVK